MLVQVKQKKRICASEDKLNVTYIEIIVGPVASHLQPKIKYIDTRNQDLGLTDFPLPSVIPFIVFICDF